MSEADSRLSPEQLELVQKRAISFQKKLVLRARGRGDGTSTEGGVFFTELFRLAGEAIEEDVETFCDRAEMVFEEIEAFGQEPGLDKGWLGEVTGDRDTFNFSTDSLVSDLVTKPRKKRRQQILSQEERDRLREVVEAAIIDDDGEGGKEQQDYKQALAVAHSENVNDWIENIRSALQENEDGVLEFWMLKERTRLRPAELFLGILLGQQHWEIGQKEFYGKVTVEMRGSKHGKGWMEKQRRQRGRKSISKDSGTLE